MKKLQTIIATTLIGTAFTFGSLAVKADDEMLVKQASVNIEQAIAIAVKAVPGTVVSAGFDKEHGQLIWEVEVLTADQKVMELDIDANDGKVIKKQVDMD